MKARDEWDSGSSDEDRSENLDTVQLGSDANLIDGVEVGGEEEEDDEEAADRTAMGVAKQLARQLAVKPKLDLPDYGTSWALDAFWLLHNAIRRELLDLYSIVMSMERRTDFNVAEETMELVIWWKTFFELVTSIFGIENRIVFPWAFRNRKGQPGFLDIKEKITSRQQVIVGRITEIEPLLLKFHANPSSRRYDLMVLKIDSFIKLLVDHFLIIETSLEPMISKNFNSQTMKGIEARMVAAVLDLPKNGETFVCLVMAMTSPQRARFVNKYLNSIQYTEYKTVWRIAFDQGHAAIPARFRQRFENF